MEEMSDYNEELTKANLPDWAKDIMIEHHTHAEIVFMGNPSAVVYTEKDVVEIIQKVVMKMGEILM